LYGKDSDYFGFAVRKLGVKAKKGRQLALPPIPLNS
jgi:hypothetical protein